MFTKNEIFNQLKAMSCPRDRVVLFHSSLRSIGEVEAGGEGLLDVLIEYFTGEGGLFCVPTHTWANIGKEVPTLDMTQAESNLGAFSRIALRDKRGVRSENPTHSMVVFGEGAKDFVEGEEKVKTPTSADGCYGRLYELGGFVLLAGVSQCKNTYLHSVDEILGTSGRMSKMLTATTVLRSTGELVARELYMFDETKIDLSRRFSKYETAFRYHGCITDGFIGNAPTQLCSARKMKEVIELIYRNAGDYDPLSDEAPLSPSLYCTKR